MSHESVTDAELRVEASFDEEVVGLALSGSADTRSMAALGKVVSRAKTEARRSSVREIVVDLRELDFMNSSCFKYFVSWICAAQEEVPAAIHRFRFRSDPKRLWQRRSLHALHGLATELVIIES